jgi:2-(1,2-epoxy-1,2-dihydrophenyl)acetyl-CoA isomerase
MTFVTRDYDEDLLIITLNRPERRNAISVELATDLLEAVQAAALDTRARAVMLRGAAGTFCVGGDVKQMDQGKGRDAPLEQRVTQLRHLMEATRLLHDMPKPTIAAIEGAAAGGGLSLALGCDLRIAARSAVITTAFAKVALPGDFGGTWLMTRLLGSAKARELYFLCPRLSADEALAHGLLTRVVDDADLASEARAMALSLARGPSVTLGYMKRSLNLAEHASFEAVLDHEALAQTRATDTADHREAARAFVEKRAPVFHGL